MLPFDNKNELLLVLDFDEGTTLERTDAAVRDFEAEVAKVPEVTDYVSYVGVPSPIDFNGLVRHYYLRQMPHKAEVRVNLVGKKNRDGAEPRDRAAAARRPDRAGASGTTPGSKIVELPPGPPVLATLVAEVYGRAGPLLRRPDRRRRHGGPAAPRRTGGRGGRRHGRGAGQRSSCS